MHSSPINKDAVVVEVPQRTWPGRLQHTDTDLALRGASEPHFDDRRGKEGRKRREGSKKENYKSTDASSGRIATVKKVKN